MNLTTGAPRTAWKPQLCFIADTLPSDTFFILEASVPLRAKLSSRDDTLAFPLSFHPLPPDASLHRAACLNVTVYTFVRRLRPCVCVCVQVIIDGF